MYGTHRAQSLAVLQVIQTATPCLLLKLPQCKPLWLTRLLSECPSLRSCIGLIKPFRLTAAECLGAENPRWPDLQAVNRNNTPWVVVGFHRCTHQRQAYDCSYDATVGAFLF